jgi:2-dehydropantoate 2-reductase
MKTAVVGAGAMGSLFGALLAEAGVDVRLIDIWKEHVAAVNQNGLTVESEGHVRQVRIKAAVAPESTGSVDLIILFVKSAQTEAAARTAAGLAGPDSLVLTLQNGLGNADTISEIIDPQRVVAGTTAHGATILGPGKVRHAGRGATVIGMWAGGDNAPARQIADRFTTAGIETEISDDILQVVWQKLLVNVGINAITALTGIKNGRILDLEASRNLSVAAVEEAAAVARALGVDVRPDAAAHVLKIAEATGSNRSSMGQDIDARRQTEIDVINGVVVREARKAGLKAPVNQTLTALVETLQANYR